MIEDIVFWIMFLSMLILLIIFIFRSLFAVMFYFKKMDKSNVVIKPVKIPSGDIKMNGKLILPKIALEDTNTPKSKLPLIFYNHGWRMNIDMPFLMEFAVALALGGPYAVLAYDCRGHGKTPGKRILSPKILDDLPNVFNFGEKLDEIDPNRMGFMGISFGGGAALTRAYVDERLKAIVAWASPHDIKSVFSRKGETLKAKLQLRGLRLMNVKGEKLSDEDNEKISPRFILDKNKKDLNSRVFVIHANHDNAIPIEEFKKNREILGTPDDQVLLLDKGGHMALHQETLILATALSFFKSTL